MLSLGSREAINNRCDLEISKSSRVSMIVCGIIIHTVGDTGAKLMTGVTDELSYMYYLAPLYTAVFLLTRCHL